MPADVEILSQESEGSGRMSQTHVKLKSATTDSILDYPNPQAVLPHLLPEKRKVETFLPPRKPS
jgi:hypothetical protein